MRVDRRSAIATALASGAVLSLGELAGRHRPTGGQESTPQVAVDEDPQDLDRQAVMAAGFTDDEAECWKLVAEAAGKFFELPELHPLDKAEVVTAVHVIQNKLLSRPTYRTYIAEAKKLRGED